MAAGYEKLTFPGAGGELLAARLDSPIGKPRAYALFAHCFTCTKDIYAASRIAAGLAAEGIAVLRFDFTGLGASEGEFANTNFSSNVADLVKAADFLRETREAPKILIGHSLGGAAVLAAARSVPEALAVATIGAPSEPSHVAHLFQDAKPDIEARGEAEVLLAGRPFRIKKQFLDDISERNLTESVSSLKKALIVFHSPIDQTVGIENAAAIFSAAKHPRSFVSLDTADHLVSKKSDAAYIATVLSAWATRYLGEAEAVGVDLKAQSGTVVVRETGEGKFTQAIATEFYPLRADEPKSYGGDESGATPYDLLLSGLGACTSMTIRLYADRKGWPLDQVEVTLSHNKIHAEDCADCETKSGRLDLVERQVRVSGDLSDEQRSRLLEIADKCPVHRTLESEVIVRTSLV
ncbi:bifunctional alpha/beta hydrolase/OsmC family protein [Denitrobaculum tricleocarpae]|uniref:Alpha/beta fold hydrolase n=1 Tax=Denitrobaculum tricleocarpae TaxID=2591009 RepID=A0A545TQ27_9PROT|nr:alpha/beta fold hydrolase [Denitrobaculum tricleocarpae]TQV79336.1 alpha/beta fold hydrolase [Denitrobaculum tricleocarpae]